MQLPSGRVIFMRFDLSTPFPSPVR
jgi:hypothetical protein